MLPAYQVPNMVLIKYQVVCKAGRSSRDCATEVWHLKYSASSTCSCPMARRAHLEPHRVHPSTTLHRNLSLVPLTCTID